MYITIVMFITIKQNDKLLVIFMISIYLWRKTLQGFFRAHNPLPIRYTVDKHSFSGFRGKSVQMSIGTEVFVVYWVSFIAEKVKANRLPLNLSQCSCGLQVQTLHSLRGKFSVIRWSSWSTMMMLTSNSKRTKTNILSHHEGSKAPHWAEIIWQADVGRDEGS